QPLFDVPLEFSLQRRVLNATLAAVDDPVTHRLQHETRDGDLVLTFEWQDHYSEEFNYIHRGEAWIDGDTGRLLRIVNLIDRPDQEPYPARTFTVREVEILPAGSSPAGAYEIGGATVPPTATPTPDAMGMYRGLPLEQAQAL